MDPPAGSQLGGARSAEPVRRSERGELHVVARRGAQPPGAGHQDAMERLINSLRGRVLVINAALAPLLYLGVSAIVEDGYAERFVNSVRSYSHLVADQLEVEDADDFDARAAYVLDDVVLSGQVVFAELTDGERRIHSSIGSLSTPIPRADDFHFGEHGDRAYYISHTIKR